MLGLLRAKLILASMLCNKSKYTQASPEDEGVSAHDGAWFIDQAPSSTNEVTTGHPSSAVQRTQIFRAGTEATFYSF